MSKKGIYIKSLEKPKCCNDCIFHTSELVLADFKDRTLYKRIVNCKLIPDYEEDGWHDFDWAEKHIQNWCPIKEAK